MASELSQDADASGRSIVLSEVCITAGGKTLLENISTEIPADCITVIVGPSGAGKSVLLRILAGLIASDDPVLRWTGSIDHGEGIPLGRIGIVFQQFALFDEWSPFSNVQFAIDHRCRRDCIPEQTAKAWLDELRVPSGVPVAGLSGGQKQRLAIARTLAADPEVVLYDEPTSGLDAASGTQVAQLIRRTQRNHRRTSIVVTHDYETLLPIADHVLLFDAANRRLSFVPREEWGEIPSRMEAARPVGNQGDEECRESTAKKSGAIVRLGGDLWCRFILGLETTGNAVLATVEMPWALVPRWPRVRWGLRFSMHYMKLVAGPSAWLYLVMSGAIIGFTSTYFTFKFLPYQLYTKPLLLEDLLASIGFALYRVLVPILATILIAARCGAAVAADVGVKRYGAQVEALQTLGVNPRIYLLTPILFAFLIGTPFLEWLAFTSAKIVSLVCFVATHPERGPYYWEIHFTNRLRLADSSFFDGYDWLMVKNILCGLGIGLLAFYRGCRPKQSAIDVSESITSTVLWATLYVLMVHFVIAFYEF